VRRLLWILVCCCVTLSLFAGCGSGKAEYIPTGNGLSVEDEVASAPTQAPEEEQVLTLTYYPDRSMNPILCTDFTNRALFSLLYQGLFAVDRDYNVEPILCNKYSVSEDMKTYTFYVEKATFSNGKPLTAGDVLATLLAAKESDYYSGRFQYVEEITLSWDGGVTVQLSTGYENFPMLMDIPIIPADQLESDNPSGTGPYILSGEYLRKRTNWWCNADMIITAPSIALVRAESPAQIRDEFEFSDLSLVCADPGSDRYADYRSDYELWDCENGIFLYMTFSKGSVVFQDPAVRSALTYAIDRNTLVKEYYRGFARGATLPASPLFPYYSQTLAEKYEYAPMKFAHIIKDMELRDSTIKFLVNKEDTLRLRVARAIAKMISDCGLEVEMLELVGNEYLYALQTWNFDLFLGQTKLSANMDLSAFFSTYGELSYGGVNDLTTYALCQQALENHGNYYTLHQTIMDNGMICPVLFRSYAIYATRGLLTGLTPARDNVFYYSLGKTMEKARIRSTGSDPVQ